MPENLSAGDGWGRENLPYAATADGRVLTRFGDYAVDLARLTAPPVDSAVLAGSLDRLMALGPDAWSAVRSWLQDAVDSPSADGARVELSDVDLVLPFTVGDYVDFYASEHHATNMGRMLRPGQEPLPAAWKHLPIGYHGRSGTVVVSGEPVPRPCGLRPPGPDEEAPSFGPTRRLDVEVEVGFVVGAGSKRGEPVDVADAARHVFGIVVVNDWSARDIQAFEYQPLGPFLGKSFATSISPWVVPLAAFEPYRVEGPPLDFDPAAYLMQAEPRGIDLRLELELNGTVVSRTSARDLYWSFAQQLAHMTASGASTRTGDLYASGTVSGPDAGSEGSLMELSWRGERPISLDDGTTRTWLEDGDTAVIRGWCGGDSPPNALVSLGEVSGTILPAGFAIERTT